MRKINGWSLLCVALLAPVMPAIAAQRLHQPGAACLTTTNTHTAARSGYGIVNTDSTQAMNLYCPVQFNSTTLGPQTVDPGQARLDYWASAAAIGNEIVCAPFLAKGTTLSTVNLGNRYSCSTPGGCATSGGTPANGVGYIAWPDTLGPTSDVAAAFINCLLPIRTGGTYTTVKTYSLELISP